MSEPEALDEIAFLARSPNRCEILDLLTTGPATQPGLSSSLDVSRTTLWRCLEDLQASGWIDQRDDQYILSNRGSLVWDAFSDLAWTVRATSELEELVEHLPTRETDIPIWRFLEADIARPTPSDPEAPMRLAYQQAEQAEDVRILSHALTSPVLDAIYDHVLAGETTAELIVTDEVLAVMASDQKVAAQMVDLVSSGGMQVFRHDPIPHLLGILDDEVGLGVEDDTGRPLATVRIKDPVVHNWAVQVYERHREAAVLVDSGRFEA